MAFFTKSATATLVNPVDGSTILTLPLRDISVQETDALVERKYARDTNSSSPVVRRRASVSFKKDVDSFALIDTIRQWQNGFLYYQMGSDLKGKRYRHPHVKLALAEGSSLEQITLYDCSLGNYSTSLGQGQMNEQFTLNALGGIDNPSAGKGEPTAPLVAFHRTGTATYLNTAGTLTTATDGQARIGLPYVVRRNLIPSSQSFLGSDWGKTRGAFTANQDIAPDGTNTASKWASTDASGENYFFTSGLTGIASAQYVFSIHVKKGDKSFVHLLGWDASANGVRVWFNLDTKAAASGQAFGTGWSVTGSVVDLGNGWLRVIGVFTTGATTTKQFRASVSAGDGNSNGVTVGSYAYFWGAQVEQASAVTPYQATNASGVDLTNPVNGAGLVLEGRTTNYFASNVATGTDALGDTTGFSASDGILVNGGATLASTTAQAFQGSRSLSVTTTTASSAQGVLFSPYVSLGANLTYTVSVRVKAPVGTPLQFRLGDYTNGVFTTLQSFTATGGWDYIWDKITTGGSGVLSFKACVRTANAQAVTFYVDAAQIEDGSFPTSWVDGTRNADLCGIVSPHNLLKWSEQLGASVWIGSTYTISANATTAPDGTATADQISATGGDSNLVQYVNSFTPGNTYTASIWLKAASPTTMRLYIVDGSGYLNYVVASVTTSWQRFAVSLTTDSLAGNLRLQLGGAGTFTPGMSVYVWGAQLVEGSHPGVYVRTTDTAIPKPADGGLDPAWVQNGRIAFRAVTPFAYLKKIAYFGCPLNEGPVSASQLGIGRVSTDTSGTYQVYACRQHNGSTGTNGVAGSAYAGSGNIDVWDNAAHYWIIEWTNYTLNGVQYMYLRLYVDSVLKVELNAAALFGATAWATIDPSKLISDGNTFATLSNLTLGYPTLPTGAIPAV